MASRSDEAFRGLVAALSSLGVRWYLFGAQAAIVHGAVRFTEDIDVTVLLGGVEQNTLVGALASHGFSLRVEAVNDFVARTRVIPLVHTTSRIPVDVVLGGPGLEERFAANARPMELGGVAVPVAAVEDLIAMKILAGRGKDLEDVVAVLTAQPKLDLGPVRETVALIERALDQSDLSQLLERCIAEARRES